MTQADALDILKSGANVFLTGEPGSGKSHTVRAYVKCLQSRGITPALTASTGIAATHIGGMTIHSWSGLGIRKSITHRECKELAKNATLSKRIKGARVLIIDEISMMDASMLDSLDLLCRVIKNLDLSFGGMQIVLVGDFFQLPPVSRPGEPPVYFAFQAHAWKNAELTMCYLSEQHRQEDKTFLNILSALRTRALTEEHIAHLFLRKQPSPDKDITKLYSHNADVDHMNTNRLKLLKGKEKTFMMSAHGNTKIVEALKRGCLSPETLTLKIGARVMCTKNNLTKSYANGSTGEVVDFDKERGFPVVQLTSGRVVCVEPETWSVDDSGAALAAIRQVPLRLAWAITVHKSQGMSLDRAYIDLGNAFVYGQGYVALSRIRSLSGLFLGGINTRALEVDPEILTEDETFRLQSAQTEKRLQQLNPNERSAAWEAFIKSCGGKKEPVIKETLDAFSIYFKNPAKKPKEPKWAPTLALIIEGKSIHDVAKERTRTVGTILDHLIEAQSLEKLPNNAFARIKMDNEALVAKVHPVMKKLGTETLRPIFDHFQSEYSYDDLKIAKWLFDHKRKTS
jgi:ATP-dependent DNA helicase PIF1